MEEIMFESTTLYYFFSTLAQVLAAITALVAVLVHFRISALRDFLIGDGESVLKRKLDFGNTQGYDLLTDLNSNRLKDSIYRKDINGIRQVLAELAQLEANKNISSDHHGFQWLLSFFLTSEEEITQMSKTSKSSFIIAFVTALYSVIAILFVDISLKNNYFQFFLVSIDIVLLGFCCFFIIKGVGLAFKNFINRFE